MIMVLTALVLGIVCGQFLVGSPILEHMGFLTDLSLLLLVVFAGIDIGTQKGIWEDFKRIGLKSLLIPAGTLIGSLLGGALCGLLFGDPMNHGLSIAVGMGFSPLVGVMLNDLSGPLLSTIGFFANFFHNLFARFCVPILAKRCNKITAVSPPGVTSMDACLSHILKHTDAATAVIAVIHGVILTVLVPVLIPIVYDLF